MAAPTPPGNPFHYYLGSLASTTVIDEVSLTAMSWTPAVDRAGTWTAVLNPGEPLLDLLLNEWEAVIYVGIGAEPPLWAGVVDTPKWTASAQGNGWTIGGAELIGYLDRVFLHDDQTITSMEQFTLARILLSRAPDWQAGNRAFPGETTDVVRDLSWSSTQLQSILYQLQQLAAFDDGFDFSLGLDWAASGSPGADVTRTVDLWYPRMGTVKNVLWEHGHAINITAVTRDGTSRSNKAWCPGASTASTPALESASGPLQGPLLEMVLPQKNVSETSSLIASATAAIERNTNALVTITCDVDVTHAEATFGTWKVGDIVNVKAADVDLVIPSDRFPDSQYRISTATHTVADDGTITVTGATLTQITAGDPIFRPNGFRDLATLARRVRTLELNAIGAG